MDFLHRLGYAVAEMAAAPRIVVLIPCYNEEGTIGTVVRDFSSALPEAAIYVYDNNSMDRSRTIAESAGALVRSEPRQGKGNVVCRMFADIDADIYLLVDGDDTYDASCARQMVEMLQSRQLDMVNGARLATSPDAYRAGHAAGNRLLTGLVARIFGDHFSDMLSGYRAFSRRFVKSFPALASGFEIETALTIHALELKMPAAEIPTPYKHRPEGSASKLHTIRDGLRIIWTIARLIEEERPLQFFSVVGILCALTALALAYPVFVTFLETGLVPRLPTAVLSASLMLLAFLSLAAGLIIDMVTLGRREAKRLAYLAFSAPSAPGLSTAGRILPEWQSESREY